MACFLLLIWNAAVLSADGTVSKLKAFNLEMQAYSHHEESIVKQYSEPDGTTVNLWFVRTGNPS